MKGSSLLGRLTTQGVTDPEGTWGVDKTAPGRGEDRAPACQKRLGESGPAGETGPGLRGHVTLSASGSGRWGRPCQSENANHAYIRGKNAYAAAELNRFWIKPRDALPHFLQWLHDRPAQTPQTAPARTGSPAACIPGAIARRRRILRRVG